MINYLQRLGFGAAPIGDQWGYVPEDIALSTVQAALGAGINYIDTSPFYGLGLSEQRVGLALYGIPRDRFILSTKVGNMIGDDGKFRVDYSAEAVLRSLHGSLERLQVQKVDMLLIHEAALMNSQQYFPVMIEQAYPVLEELRRQGAVTAIGAGLNTNEAVFALLPYTDLDCVLLAGRYTLLNQDGLASLAECQRCGISVILGGIYNSGVLAVGPRQGAWYNYAPADDEVLNHVRKLEAVCLSHKVSLQAAATHFPLLHPAVTSVVVGARQPHEILAAVRALQTRIPPALWSDLRGEGLINPAAPILERI